MSKKQKMNGILRVTFILVIIAMTSASLLHLFFPDFMGSRSAYGISHGWQREIAFWDLAVIIILLAVNINYDWFYLRAVLIALIIGGIGIGTNHLLGFIREPSQIINLVGALENYGLVVAWLIGWRFEMRLRAASANSSPD